MSLIQKFKEGLFKDTSVNVTSKPDLTKSNINDKNKMMQQSKGRSASQINPQTNKTSHNVSLNSHQNQANYQNLSRKAYMPHSSKDRLTKPSQKEDKPQEFKKKIKLQNLMMNPIDELSKEITANNQEREKENQYETNIQNQVKEENNKVGENAALSVRETLDKMKQKLASAQRKMNFNFNANKAPLVSNFETDKGSHLIVPITKKEVHSTDQILNTGDQSDIKNTSKHLFQNSESTALMTSKTGNSRNATTPNTYEASQFTLNILGDSESTAKTPAQFKSNTSKSTLQDTDDQGNRLSILPSAERPRKPSTKKASTLKSHATKKTSVKKASVKKQTKKQDKLEEEKGEEEAPQNQLEKIRQENKVKESSKGITKRGESNVRQNFVRMNMQNYKPRMRGAAFSNKIMAKKRNFIRNKEAFKRKMQIENAKNRDQVNMYGGLGKVGFDHKKFGGEQGDDAEVAPGFSASALKYVKIVEEEVEGIEEFLAEDLENMKDELEQIDEEVKEEDIIEACDFDQPLYKRLPKSDEEYTQILQERFGHESFKEGQLEALKIILEQKKNTMVVLATGAGKSLVYQYASMFLPGLVLIVTPLIALMSDQLNKIPSFITGASLNSSHSYMLKKQIMQAVADKKIKILFISPERFFLEDFTKFNRQISMVCVDEIHCASEWSHNFRPAYLKINDMIKEKVGPNSVMLGLTATATKATQKSICDIFSIQHPEHIVTQPDLSRFNLQLSITRDVEKQRALLTLLKSDSFRKLDSILIYATHKRTCDLLASFLTVFNLYIIIQIYSKTDQAVNLTMQVKCLVCTIAFSMGIDKSDVQSVIHYDMPKSIENYVQEIGRAGRDGKLARCHLFLNNDDFFLIRRLILQELLDNYTALKLTNKIIVEAKKTLISHIKPELLMTKKRRRNQMSKKNNDDEPEEKLIIEEFEHENEIKQYYSKDKQTGVQRILFSTIEEDINPNQMYVFLDTKETCSVLDLKREVVMTMLNSLEKLPEGKRFFKFEGVLPSSIGLRFHKTKPEELAKNNAFIKSFISLSKEHQGVHRCDIQKVAYDMDISPFGIPKILYGLQNADDGEITYELDQECFVLRLLHIPYGGNTLEIAQDMLAETRKIEKNMVQKLNCMYFVARRVSMATVEAMLKKEKQESDPTAMYKGFSKQLNELINMYFNITNEGKTIRKMIVFLDDMEIQIAGDAEERNIMMPLQYIDSHREKAHVESEIKFVLRDYHDQGQATFDANERMRPLDIVKILMGIYSDKGSIKRFMNNSKVWAKFQDYDYEDLFKVAQSTVNQFYLDQVNGGSNSTNGNNTKERQSNLTDKDEQIPSGPVSKRRNISD